MYVNRESTLLQTTVLKVITMLDLLWGRGELFLKNEPTSQLKLFSLTQFQILQALLLVLCRLSFLKKEVAHLQTQFYVIYVQSKVVIVPKKHVYILQVPLIHCQVRQ